MADATTPFIANSGGRNRNSLIGSMPSTPEAQSSAIPLTPPNPPFSIGASGRPNSGISISSLTPSQQEKRDNRSSLSINYLPSKFSRPHSPGISYRKANTGGKKGGPKRGGGRDAFADGAARMPGANDTDYDGIAVDGWFQGKPMNLQRLHWNRFKWILIFMNTLLTAWTMAALVVCLLTWFNFWNHADIIRVGNETELIISTVAASVGIFTSLLGWAGLLLNNRAFLGFYTLFLWFTFGLLVTPGYITYKRNTFNLEGKTNFQWSRTIGVAGRLRIQNELGCCGYYSPFIEATISQTCYARSTLQGCKGPYLEFERFLLKRWYIASFALVPLQLACIYAALLCSNHITYRFGKGMMPKAYRLNQESMAVILDNYANQLAEQYGDDVAQDVLSRSRSNLALDNLSYSSHGGGNRGSTWSGTTVPVGGNSPYGQYGPVNTGAAGAEDDGKQGKRG
ncbi:hypothetical protein FRB96_008559 [Tulasnella sp. 330]|nr:hypothetical protein FRB96_008559 [Tulasnella sp. 330]KAG8870712.1 hypothetical protein FRB97_009457 [Tulasnella sp. 331]KAG8872966.1 hypothetical protein FRB98_009280 [Tulasnella sp. 332]